MINKQEFRRTYDALVAETGQPPTVSQLQERLEGATMQSVYCHLCRHKLPWRKLTTAERGALSRKMWAEQYKRRQEKQTAEKPEPRPKALAAPGVRVYHVEPVNLRGIRPLLLPPEGRMLPGKSAQMGDVRLVHCCRCARRFVLRLRMHAWWADAEEGLKAPVCSDVCAGTPLMRKL